MKYTNRLFALMLAALVCPAARPAFAQSVPTVSISAEARIGSWIDSELTAHPQKRWLASHADAYVRCLRIDAARALGISISELSKEQIDEPPLIQSEPNDFGMARNASKSKSSWQNETSIAIDRKSPNIIIAGANDKNMSNSGGMPVYYSTNFGQTWSTAHIPPGGSGQNFAIGDPMLASGPDGTLYYAYLMDQPYSSGTDNLFVATSLNGKSWTNGSPVLGSDTLSGFEDKEQIAVDMSPLSHSYGRVYLVWAHYDSGNQIQTGRVLIVHSDDRCKTWSSPVVIAETMGQFSEVRTGMNGEVLVTFGDPGDFTTGGGEDNLYVSTDGGETFTVNPIASYRLYPSNQDNRSSLKGYQGPRCYPYIAFDVDRRTNLIHLVYGDNYNDDAVQYYVNSSNLGQSWSSPTAVGYHAPTPGDAPVLDRFDPWVSVNQSNGDALLTYYSSERDPSNALISTFRVHLNASGPEPSKSLDTTDFDPTLVLTSQTATPFIGDYIGSDQFDTVYAAAWTEGVGSDGEVYVYVGLPTPPGTSNGVTATIVSSSNLRISSVFPNPVAGNSVTLGYYSPVSGEGQLSLYDLRGARIAVLWSGPLDAETASHIVASLPRVAPGTYLLCMSCAGMSDERKIVIR